MKSKGFELIAQCCLILVLSLFLGVIYVASFHFLHSETVYYFGIGAILVGAIILAIIFLALFRKIKFAFEKLSLAARDFFPCLLTAVFIIYSFHITFPSLIDRSISIYLLNQLAEEGGSASLSDLQQRFLNGYVSGVSVVCRRMAEQIETGNITHNGSIYSLTPRGQKTIQSLRAFAEITGVNPYYAKSNNPDLLPYKYVETANGCEFKL